MKIRIKKGLMALSVMTLAVGAVGITPTLARNKTGWIIRNPNGKITEVPEGTPGAVMRNKSGVLKPTDPATPVNPSVENKSGTMQSGDAAIPPVNGDIQLDCPPGVERPCQHLDRGNRPHSVERGKSGTIPPDTSGVSTVARSKTGWLVPLLGVVAVGGGILAATGGGGSPKSP
jgi:hypothetical protein